MRSSLRLITSDYQFVMYLSSLDDSNDRLGIIALISPNENFELSVMRSKAKTIFLEDIRKLSLYLASHLEKRLNDESHVFMGYDCTFQIQALNGVMAPYTDDALKEDDAFTISCLVNVRSTDRTSFDAYFGGESVVTVANCREFIRSLDKAYADFKAMFA